MAAWLVTGGSGFLGRHVLDALGDRAIALGRRPPPGRPSRAFVVADLERPETVARAVREVRPDYVIHAAGRTPPADADACYRANTLATLHLLDALRIEGRPVRVVLAGSAAELGPVPVDRLPVGEDEPCRPVDPYGLSKWLATCAGLSAAPPVEVVVGRVFNPVGPGQPLTQAFGRFAQHLLRPNPGPLDVGDLATRRDFVDVRDVARALILLAERGNAGLVYHVGTGRSRSVGDGLARLLARSGRRVEVRESAAYRGPSDSRADVSRLSSHTGWRPEIPFEASLDALWDEAEARSRLPLTA